MKIRARRVRHRTLERTRRSRRFLEWIALQADRLGVTEQAVFDMLTSGLTAEQVESTEPEPEPEEPEEDPIP